MNFLLYLSKHSLESGEHTREKPNAVLLSDNERLFQNVPDVFHLNGERFTKRFDGTLVDEIAQESVAVKRYHLLVYSSFPFHPVFIPLPYPSGIRTLGIICIAGRGLHNGHVVTSQTIKIFCRFLFNLPVNSGYTPVSLREPRNRSNFFHSLLFAIDTWLLVDKVYFYKNIDSCFVQRLSTKSPRESIRSEDDLIEYGL